MRGTLSWIRGLLMGHINLIAQIEARVDTVDAVHTLMNSYAEHVLGMDGSERFEVHRDRDRQTRIVILERYRDDQAFAEHLADPENETLNARLGELTEGGSELQFLI